MNIKNITVEELKKHYSDRNGFIFKGASDCDPRYCDQAAKGILAKGYSEELPEFVGQIDNRTFAFVYPEGSSFSTPDFIEYCKYFIFVSRAFEIDALCAWLRELKTN